MSSVIHVIADAQVTIAASIEVKHATVYSAAYIP